MSQPEASKVIRLHASDAEPQLAEALEDMLERVRHGEIAGIVAAFVAPDGECTYMLSGLALESPAVAATVASRLKARVDRYVMD